MKTMDEVQVWGIITTGIRTLENVRRESYHGESAMGYQASSLPSIQNENRISFSKHQHEILV